MSILESLWLVILTCLVYNKFPFFFSLLVVDMFIIMYLRIVKKTNVFVSFTGLSIKLVK